MPVHRILIRRILVGKAAHSYYVFVALKRCNLKIVLVFRNLGYHLFQFNLYGYTVNGCIYFEPCCNEIAPTGYIGQLLAEA